jgi:hypothetical protein
MIKSFPEMTDEELRAEFERWDREVREATCWGAGLMQAAKWRDGCERLLVERGLIDKANPAIRIGEQARNGG